MISYHFEAYADCHEELYPHMIMHYHEIEPDARTLPFSLDVEKYLHLDRKGQLVTLVVRDDGVICGYLWGLLHKGMHSSRNLFFTTDAFYVAPHRRNKLIGLTMFRKMHGFLKKMGVDRWVMSCMVDKNTTALFKRLGAKPFEIVHAIALKD